MVLDQHRDGKEKKLDAGPRDFHHPYTPYDIQETFMSTVYQVLKDGKVGILESPTGTVSLYQSPRDIYQWPSLILHKMVS